MPNTEITDDYIKNAILSTTSTGAYLIKIIQDNNVCAILQGHNVSENYRFYVAFSYYNIGYVNKIKTFKLRLEEWTIETYITNTDLFSVHFIAQTLNGYVEYFDARIKSDMNCVASIKYSSVVLNYILNVQVHNGSLIIYVRTPEGTIPQDNTNINIYAIFAK